MRVRVLGAHNLPSRDPIHNRGTRHTCFLIDDVLGVDMGGMASALSPTEQGQVLAILLTHRHFDHIRDLPSLALMTLDDPRPIDVYSLPETLEGVLAHLINGDIYPDFTQKLTDAPPKYRFLPVEPGVKFKLLDYDIKPIPQPHPVPCVGYIVKSKAGACWAYTGDTGGNLLPFFQDKLSPQVLFIDITFPSRLEALAKLTGHLTPGLLREELLEVMGAKLSLPRMVAVHISVPYLEEVEQEVASLANELGIDLIPGAEDMLVAL